MLQAYIEGPYGSPKIDMHGSGYNCFLVITSGIFWTFLRAWKRQLVHDASRGMPVVAIKTVAILWADDAHQFCEFSGWDMPGYGVLKDNGIRAEVCNLLCAAPVHTVVPAVHNC